MTIIGTTEAPEPEPDLGLYYLIERFFDALARTALFSALGWFIRGPVGPSE